MLKKISIFIVVAVLLVFSGCSNNEVSINDAENTAVNQQQDDNAVNHTEPTATPEITQAPTAAPEVKGEPTPTTTEELKPETNPIATQEPTPSSKPIEPIIKEEIPVAPKVTPTPTPEPTITPEPTNPTVKPQEPTIVKEKEEELIEEVEAPISNMSIIEDVN